MSYISEERWIELINESGAPPTIGEQKAVDSWRSYENRMAEEKRVRQERYEQRLAKIAEQRKNRNGRRNIRNKLKRRKK